MRVSLREHLAIGRPFVHALQASGHEVTSYAPDVYLLDLDLDYNRPLIDAHIAQGAKVFTYPHGVGVHHYWDGISEPYDGISGTFVIAEGYAEVYRRWFGMERPFYVVGWPYCEQKPFRATDNPRKVLFAAEHPLENGEMVDWLKDINRTTFEALRAVPGIELTVRHLQALERNGIPREPGVTYIEGQPDNSFDDIDRADVVVATGTYAHLAIARGAPTIMFGQHVHPSNGEHAGNVRVYAERWHEWGPYARFPFDITDGPAAELIAAAAASEDPVREWKRLFIGDPMTPERFSAVLTQAMKDSTELPETRSFVVLTEAEELVRDTGLLKAYSEAFGPADDATLVLVAAPGDQSALVERLGTLFAELDLPDDTLPDMVLSPDPGIAGRMAFADLAHARLSEHDMDGAWGSLPRYGSGSARALREAAASAALEPVSS